jgi:hypothetical protein
VVNKEEVPATAPIGVGDAAARDAAFFYYKHLKSMREQHYSVVLLRNYGFTAAELQAEGYSEAEIKSAGYSDKDPHYPPKNKAFKDTASTFMFRSIALKLLFSSPVSKLGAALERFTKEVIKPGPLGYATVHHRTLEDECEERLRSVVPNAGRPPRPPPTPVFTVVTVSANETDICSMSSDYLRKTFENASMPLSVPKYLATDPSHPDDVARIKSLGFLEYDFKEYPKGSQGHVFVDTLVLLHSSLFVGNPASSFSTNMVTARIGAHLTGAESNNYAMPNHAVQIPERRLG